MKIRGRLRLLLVLIFIFLLTSKIKDSPPYLYLKKSAQSVRVDQKAPIRTQPPAALPKNVFRDNEKIKFGVYSNGIKTGSGELVYQGIVLLDSERRQRIHFQVSNFFPRIEDQEDIYGLLDFSSPVKVERRVKVFGRQEAIVENYSGDKKSVVISKRVNQKTSAARTIESGRKLDNVFLLLYSLRNDQGLKPGRTYDVVLPTQEFRLTVKDKRRLKVPLGTFETFFITSTPPKYKIWLSNDEQRVPVRIQGLTAGAVYLAAVEVN